MTLPHKIAVLCYLYDDDDRVLLLHRAQEPNKGMYSPVGGKLKVDEGEGPHDCALREIHEETGLVIEPNDLRMIGIVSETAYQLETMPIMRRSLGSRTEQGHVFARRRKTEGR